MVFSNLKVRFATTAGFIKVAGVPVELATPYTTAQLPFISYAQSGDVVYLRKGESVDGWSVIDLGDRSIAIGPPENPVTYSLFDSSEEASMPEDGQPAVPPQGQPLPLPLPLPMPAQQPRPQPGVPALPEQHSLPDTGG